MATSASHSPSCRTPPPTISGIASYVAGEDEENTTISLFDAFSDPSEPDSALSFAVTGNTNPSLFTSLWIDVGTGNLILDYAPDAHGAADITVRATDIAGGWVSTTFRVTVVSINDPPVNYIPFQQVTPPGTPLVFSAANGNGISISDADAGSQNVLVTLAAQNGTLTLPATTGLTFQAGDGTADAQMHFAGTLAAVNAALNGLRFDPAAGATAAFVTVTTDDRGNTGAGGPQIRTDTVPILVQPLPPTLSVGDATVLEGNSGTAQATFTVRLTGASASGPVTCSTPPWTAAPPRATITPPRAVC